MRLELSQFRQPETQFARTFEPAELAGDGEYRVTEPAVLKMTIHKDQANYRLVGSVQSALELDCSRCLDAFRLPVDQTFDLRYLPASTGVTATNEDDEEVEVSDDDVSITFYRDEHIDLDELLREQFYLALPMKPLCKGDCKGICPQCGANRNHTTCDCNPQWEDPRMAGLKTLVTKRKHDDA